MKIGIVTTWFERGAAYVSKQFMETLQSLGHEVFIFARGGESFAKDDLKWNLDNVTWNKFLYSPINTDIAKKQYEDWLKANKIEAVIFNEQHYWAPIIWTKKLNIPTIAYIDYYTKETMPIFEIYDQLWCNTKRHFSVFNWHSGAKYIPWGTNIKLYGSHPDNTEYTKIADKRVFFHSAGMNPHRKGTDLFLRSLAKIDDIELEKCQIVIHTQVDLIKAFPNLKQQIELLQSAGLLLIIHKTVSAPGLYYLGDAYVYPTRLEGIGLTIAEAMAAGLPVIISDEQPMNEFVYDNYPFLVDIESEGTRGDGYFWPEIEVSITSLAQKISTIINLPESELTLLKSHCIEHAKTKLNFSENISELKNCISTIELQPLNESLISMVKRIDKKNNHVFLNAQAFFRLLFSFYKRCKKLSR